MTNIRTAMNRGAFDFVTKPVDLNDLEITIRKTLDDIAKLREIERQRAAAERARTNLSRYFSPNLVEMLAEQDEPLGAVRRADRRRAVRRHRRLHPHGRGDGARGGGDHAARVPRADDGADLRLRRHRREIHRRRDLRGLRGARPRAPTTPPTRCAAPTDAGRARRLERRARGARRSRRSRSASASTTGRRCSAMSAASTACRSR